VNKCLAALSALLALGALTLAACSTGGNSSNSNPLSGISVVIPTASPVPTATPVPTASPTPAPNATQAIQDPGFESGAFGNGWTACSIPHVIPSSTATPFPVVAAGSIGAVVVSPSSSPFVANETASPEPQVTPAIHSGNNAALTYSGTQAQTVFPAAGGGKTGPGGANGVCQTFTVPTNAVLTMFVNEGGSDTGLDFADQEADIIPQSGTGAGTSTPLFFELNDPNFSGGLVPAGNTGNPAAVGTYVQKGPYALTAPPYNLTPGQSVQLFIGSFDSEPDAKFGVYMFVDDVTVTGTVPAPSSIRHAPSAGARALRAPFAGAPVIRH